MSDYDEIGGSRTRTPSNRPTTILYVAFTPAAKPEDVKNALDVHLNCVWNAQECSGMLSDQAIVTDAVGREDGTE